MRTGIRDFPRKGDVFLRTIQGLETECVATIDHLPRPTNLVTIVEACQGPDTPVCSECGRPVPDGYCPDCGVAL